ncbi:MAG: type ISP restriction/modification enzyme [Chloroflexales bacterium]
MSVTLFLAEIAGCLTSGIATEHTYRPALQQFFEAMLSPAKATNEPKHAQYGAPDFVIQQGNVPIGHVEAKDIGVKLDLIIGDSEREKPRTREGTQLRRYRAALPNLLFTDGLEWHWFVSGAARLEHPLRVATWNKAKQKLVPTPTAAADLADLLAQFAAQQIPTVNTPRELASRLAQAARWLHDVIVDVLTAQGETGDLHQQLTAFRQTLLPTLKNDEFADMYAQTIVYGLFAARVAVPEKLNFSRLDAAMAIPKTNPFLRKLFQEIAGYDLDERIAWLVDDCASLLARTDIGAVLKDFGKVTKQEDPVVHFYETFLAAYNPALRESRGVYYTPEPVVGYIVRSVDHLLTTHFHKPMGLADESTMILDPATGTATFLYAVVQRIHTTLSDMGLAGAWDSYVSEKLLRRLFGFELLMAPYTIAHLKMGLLLGQLGYHFGSNERLGIYLTNALEGVLAQMDLPFAQYIAQEAAAANMVKHHARVMVVLGNPPYAGHSSNQGQWISDLLKGTLPDGTKTASYYQVDGQPLGERNSKWLQDDYVKFIRLGQWRITQTGEGILAFITNNGYLNNPTFRGMRQSLLNDFDEIYILNLHGNIMQRERTPEGESDQNVFDIQQGVAISIFVKNKTTQSKKEVVVYYDDLWGRRDSKYKVLSLRDIEKQQGIRINPTAPFYLMVPKDDTRSEEYEKGEKIPDIFFESTIGVVTGKDEKAIAFTHVEGVDLANANSLPPSTITPILYRPFDTRYITYHKQAVTRMRLDVMRHMQQGENLALLFMRQVSVQEPYSHFGVSKAIVNNRCFYSNKGIMGFAPLYVYEDKNAPSLFATKDSHGRYSNIKPAVVERISNAVNLSFTPFGKGDLVHHFGPEDIFHYIYAIFHSPTYRTRYAEFLKIDFPRLPITRDTALFTDLVAKGAELVDLHLLRLPGSSGVGGNGGAAILVAPGKQGVNFPHSGTGIVEKVMYIAPKGNEPGRVAINSTQFFMGIDRDIWEAQIGGYQPLEKWLKDRKGRTLNMDDILHYMRMVIALRETRRIMAQIDELIPAWPLE